METLFSLEKRVSTRESSMKKIGQWIGVMACAVPMVLGTAVSLPVQAAPSGVTAVKKQIPVYRKNLSEHETVECTFFSDMPHVPYMPLEVFYTTFMDGRMSVSRDGSRYTYTDQQYGSVAVADADQDTLTSADLANFIATPVYKREDGLVMGGPDQMVQVQEVQYDKPAEPVTLNLGQYQIDLREEDGVLYFPFATVSDLFSNVDVMTAYYADDTIYFDAFYQEINGGDARSQKEDYLPWLLQEERSEDMIAFNYRELCFSVESFYGYPCSYNDFTDKMAQDGLDAAITAFDPTTKQLLLSKKPAEYVAGLYRLFGVYLADGGHTGVDLGPVFSNSDYLSAVSPTFAQYSLYGNEGDGYYIRKNRDMIQTYYTLARQRDNTLGSESYYTQGDTALISFDDFMVDYEGWDSYFAGEADEMPNDTVGFVYRCLQQAQQDTNIRNVVFDLSTNGGGDTIALDAVVGMVRGAFDCQFYNVLGQQTLTQTTVTDRNLDGAINTKDTAVRYDGLRFAVLSSGYSFSCANIMTALMKEGGYPVLGENSAGGACAVLLKATSDGLGYRLSSYARFVSPLLDTTDDGIPADVTLVSKNADGTKDYSRFYDLTAISQAVNHYYEEQESHQTSSEVSQASAAVSQVSAEVSQVSLESQEEPIPEPSDNTVKASSVPVSDGVVSRPMSEVSIAASSTDISEVTEITAPETVATSSQGTVFLVMTLFGIVAAAVIAIAVVVLVKRS